MKFCDMPYARPRAEELVERLKELTAQVEHSDSAALPALYEEADRLKSAYDTMQVLASIRYTMDTRDPFYSGERDFFDQNDPAVHNAMLDLARALLAHPGKESLAQRWGDILLQKLEIQARSADDRVLALQQEENSLETAYEKLYASAQIPFDGKTLTIAQLAPYKLSPQRTIRRLACEEEGRWFDAHRGELDDIYTKLIRNRNEQARILGFPSYVELSYLRMGRIGYGRQEVEEFRRQVAEDVVPAAAEIQRRRFDRLGVQSPKFYDTGLAFGEGNPQPLGTTAELVEKAITMYHELSPETAEFIDFMSENDLFDLEARPG